MSKKFKEKLPSNRWKLLIFDGKGKFYRCSQCAGISSLFNYSINSEASEEISLVCAECDGLEGVPDNYGWVRVKK
jgi:hypothetical protein